MGWRGSEHDPPSGQLGRETAAQHLSGARRLLQTCCHVDGVADDGDGTAGSHRLCHHLAGVHTDREDQVPPEVAHGHGGGDGSLGVVVVGQRDTEHRQDRVPHVLVDRAPVVGDDVAQLAKGRVDQPGHHFGIGALGERREAHDVGEQDRRQLALFDGGGGRRGRRAAQVRPASPAEALSVGDRRPARRAATVW